MITLFSKDNCPYCTQAKSWLTANGFEYTVVDVTADAKALEFIKARGHKKVPQMYVGENLLVEGGYTGMTSLGAAALRERLNQFSS